MARTSASFRTSGRARRAGAWLPRVARLLAAMLLLVVMVGELLGGARRATCPRRAIAGPTVEEQAPTAAAAALQADHGHGDADAPAGVPSCGATAALPAARLVDDAPGPVRQPRPDGVRTLVGGHDPPALFRPPRVS